MEVLQEVAAALAKLKPPVKPQGACEKQRALGVLGCEYESVGDEDLVGWHDKSKRKKIDYKGILIPYIHICSFVCVGRNMHVHVTSF